MGIAAIGVSLIAGGPVGVGLSAVATGAVITNEVRLSRLKHQVASDHQRVIKSVYDSQE